MRRNTNILDKLGLSSSKIKAGLQWGLIVGLLLGVLNTTVILAGTPMLGIDITFLLATPHAQVPLVMMIPWTILGIAFGVEINFRGFVLGRLVSLFAAHIPASSRQIAPGAALVLSSVTFAFDPFLVSTFQDLHWIAVWNGLVWGSIWLATRNLYLPITAHAVEVIIEVLTIRWALT